MGEISDRNSYDKLLKRLKEQEIRIANIESYLHLTPPVKQIDEVSVSKITEEDKKSNDLLEYKIGQYWFAKLGILVLLIGIAFLLIFPYQNLPAYIPSTLGFFFASALIFVSKKISDKFKYIRNYLNGGSIILLFFSILRLHYFSAQPFISNIPTETILLMIGAGISLIISLKANSPYLIGISLTEGSIAALLSENPYFIFLTITVLSASIVYFKIKYDLKSIILFGIILTYSSHFIWFIGNPITGNAVRVRYSPQINTIFLLIYIIIYSLSFIINRSNTKEEYLEVFSGAFNIILGYGLFLAITLGNTDVSFTILHSFASITFLIFAILVWSKIKGKYLTFLFAMTGYLALSIVIINQFRSPDFFIVLCWQSLLVVSTAIWFKSKFIIIANFFIYLLVFTLYVLLIGKLNSVSISYGVVALLSARVLNWKKEGLELKTEAMRNSYLILGLFIIPYALYHSFPAGWISVSWIGLSLLYYLLSVVLKSKKYRWMALTTLLFTIGYIFIFGLSNFGATDRIISFLVLGVVLLTISLLYAKIKTKSLPKDNL